MSHLLRALAVFIAIPVGFVLLIFLNAMIEGACAGTWIMQRHWWDPWVGGAAFVVLLAVLAWQVTA